VKGACEAAVERLPRQQRRVIQNTYYRAMNSTETAVALGITDSSVRTAHQGALANLRRDDVFFFEMLDAVGRVRKAQLEAARNRLQAA
jgi:hypothetical protein